MQMLETQFERIVKTSEGFKGIPKGAELKPAEDGSEAFGFPDAAPVDSDHPEIVRAFDFDIEARDACPDGTVFAYFEDRWIPEENLPPVERRPVYKTEDGVFIEDNGCPRLVKENERLYGVLKQELASAEEGKSYEWNGERWIQQDGVPMLEAERIDRLAELKEKWLRAEQAPFVCSYGKPVDADDRAVLAIESLLRISSGKVSFCFADNTFLEMTSGELESLLDEILSHRQAVHDRKFSLRDAIETESDPLALHMMEISF